MKTKKSIMRFFLSPFGGAGGGFLWGGLVGLLFFSSCSTDTKFADWQERTTPVRAIFQYMADNSERYEIEYNDAILADSLPYNTGSIFGFVYSSATSYLKESRLGGILRIYRLENGGRSLELEQQVTVSPVVIKGSGQNTYSTINLMQLSADAPVQVLQTPETPPADSSSIALQFFYADSRQPENVKITILAVDQYALLMKSSKLINVPDSMKTELEELELSRARLSKAVILNLNLYGKLGADGKPFSKGMAARFFYKVTDANGTLIQDYNVANAEIKTTSTTSTRNGVSIPRPTYKFAVMQWGYKSATIPFTSPTALINGDKW